VNLTPAGAIVYEILSLKHQKDFPSVVAQVDPSAQEAKAGYKVSSRFLVCLFVCLFVCLRTSEHLSCSTEPAKLLDLPLPQGTFPRTWQPTFAHSSL